MLLLRKFFALACWRKIMSLTLHLQIRSHHRQLIAIHILELGDLLPLEYSYHLHAVYRGDGIGGYLSLYVYLV